jgi:divalent metal cation (Fe/Co/Zn/Cd) transporter
MTDKLYSRASWLAIFTIVYNIAEGLISVFFGYTDETLSLFGFGADSFVEVVSGIGIYMMIRRIARNPESDISRHEITALRITGFGFYILALGLAAGIILNLSTHHKPESTVPGTIISAISIIVMLWLYLSKRSTGKKLDSDPILADANCTLVCIYMSVVLLASSLLYALTGFAYADALGAAGLAYFSVREGMESLEKARKRRYGDCCG